MPRSRASSPLLPEAAPAPTAGEAASTTLSKIWKLDFSRPSAPLTPLPRTSNTRLASSSDETILYLAYGSNLSAETFKGARGIQPLSALNVHVPSLDLTFDLSGMPYIEPCFANTRAHVEPPKANPPYHKDRWTKGLIGVVYEVTPEDYRTIIATEGGGSSYLDVVVPCFALPDGTQTVSDTPSGKSFQAHTLQQPADEDESMRKTSTRIHRPDPSYAQPSARYLKLVTDGAEEHSLPDEYLAYLHNIRPYTMTTVKQRIGRGLIVALFGPILMVLFGLSKVFADDEGKIPEWFASIMALLFRVVWWTYDGFLVKAFGDGERTMKNDSRAGEGSVVKGTDEEASLREVHVAPGKGVRLEGGERRLK